MKPITLYGAGGHAFAVVELIRSLGIFNPEVIIDQAPKTGEILGVSVRKPLEGETMTNLCLSIGNNRDRQLLAGKFNCHYPVFVHESAVTYPSVELGEGTVVLPNAVLDADVIVGKHCIINNHATISHNVRIGDFAHIAIQAAVAGLVTIGEGSLIGAGSIVLPGIKIGKWAVVGAGAVVTRDVPDNSAVMGAPAKIIRTN